LLSLHGFLMSTSSFSALASAPALFARRIEAQAPYEGKALAKGAKYLVDGALLSADDLGDDKEALLLEWQSCHAQKMANFHLHREHSGRFAVFPNENCPGCRVGSVPPAPLPAQALSPLPVREESKADDDIADFIREFSAHSLLLSRFPRPVLVSVRDGSFPPVALSKLLAQPPCDPAVLSAWFASSFILFYQLHSVFRPVDSSDLMQLFHRLMHWLQRGSSVDDVQAYFDAWGRKYPRHAKPFAARLHYFTSGHSGA
jgi:hypothetical protein